MDVRDVLARKLRALMENSDRYGDRKTLGRAAGVSARAVGYLLQKTGNPRLKTIIAVAGVFKLEAWELLIDHSVAREKLINRVFGERQWSQGDPDRRARSDRRAPGNEQAT